MSVGGTHALLLLLSVGECATDYEATAHGAVASGRELSAVGGIPPTVDGMVGLAMGSAALGSELPAVGWINCCVAPAGTVVSGSGAVAGAGKRLACCTS